MEFHLTVPTSALSLCPRLAEDELPSGVEVSIQPPQAAEAAGTPAAAAATDAGGAPPAPTPAPAQNPAPPGGPPPLSRTIGVEEAVDRMLEVLMARDREPPTIVSTPVKVCGEVDQLVP